MRVYDCIHPGVYEYMGVFVFGSSGVSQTVVSNHVRKYWKKEQPAERHSFENYNDISVK